MEYANTVGEIPTSFSAAGDVTNFDNPMQYYLNLSSSGRNFLRVPAVRNPIVDVTVNATSGQSTTVYMAQSIPGQGGILGGVTFQTGSICFGAALVLALDEADHTRDIVLARSYFTDSSERLTKSNASELFVTFPLVVNSTKAT